mgnify:CR=1 FL=1
MLIKIAPQQVEQNKVNKETIKRVLLVTRGITHPAYAARMALVHSLNQLNNIALTHIPSLEELPEDFIDYDAMVLYFHEDQISKAVLSSLESFVAEGGGVLAVHSATASFMTEEVYFKILGGRFKEHGPISRFTISPVYKTDVFNEIPSFSVEDELYQHEICADITVHFTAKSIDDEIPVVWTNYYGDGRVCYASPGHCPETMNHPEYQKLLIQGLQWVMA